MTDNTASSEPLAQLPKPVTVEEEQETGRVSPLGHETATRKTPSPKPRVSFSTKDEEIAPPKPPRPTNAQEEAEHTLIEAFPSIDAKVVRAVLTASSGQVEPAFNALLGMSDPDFQPEAEVAPAQPPRPTQRAPQAQLEADEQYARRLAEQYNNQAPRQGNTYNQREPGRRAPNQQPRPQHDRDDRMNERSFFDDELPEIGREIKQGFLETQKVVNSWITNFKKKIDGEDEEEDLYSGSSRPPQQGRENFGSSQSEQLHGIRKSADQQRRSVEQQRYDADPHVLGDEEFSRLELRDDETPPAQPPRTSSRKQANPDLFKPHPAPPQSGPVDEVEAAERSSRPSNDDKARKWQPLTSVQPAPEDDNDPFSLGDDDEGNDKVEDMRKEDSERLKAKARGSMSEGAKPVLVEAERSGSVGTRDKEAEELLTGKKA